MRFEGDEDGEKRAAGLIQEAVFRMLEQEKMCVKNFVNVTITPEPQTSFQTDAVLQIPEFMKKRMNKQKTR